MKEEIFGNVKARKKNDKLIAVELTLGKALIQIICASGTQRGRPHIEIVCFHDEMANKWDLESSCQTIFFSENFIGYAEICFVVVQRGMKLEKEM